MNGPRRPSYQPTGGSSAARLVASGVPVATALALDASNVYLATPHSVWRISK